MLPARQVDVTLGYVGSALARRHCGRRTEAVMRKICSLVRLLVRAQLPSPSRVVPHRTLATGGGENRARLTPASPIFRSAITRAGSSRASGASCADAALSGGSHQSDRRLGVRRPQRLLLVASEAAARQQWHQHGFTGGPAVLDASRSSRPALEYVAVGCGQRPKSPNLAWARRNPGPVDRARIRHAVDSAAGLLLRAVGI